MKHFLLYVIVAFTFSYGCQNRADDKYSPPLNDSTSVSGLTGDSVKLVKTAAIDLKVKNVERGTKTVSEVAAKYGGNIHFQNFQAAEINRKEVKVSDDSILVISTTAPQANITVRIPSDKLEPFLYDVSDIGYFTSNLQLKIDDKSLTYLENILKQRARVESFQKTNNSQAKATARLQAIQTKDEITAQLIANKAIDADVNYSTVTLNLFQNVLVKKEMIANYVVADYELPFGQRLKNALSQGWELFLNLLIALSHLWSLILLALIAYIFYKSYQSKRKVVG